MSGSAQRDDFTEELDWQATGTESSGALRAVVAERVAAHRNRRAAVEAMEATREAAARRDAARRARNGASRIREAVAARYERTQSYREFLAAEAERALQQAQAEAEIAARNARAVAEAQMELMAELDGWNEPEPSPRDLALEQHRAEARGELAQALTEIALGARELMEEAAQPSLTAEAVVTTLAAPLAIGEAAPDAPAAPAATRSRSRKSTPAAATQPAAAAPVTEVSAGGLTVRLYEDMPATPAQAQQGTRNVRRDAVEVQAEELQELDQEIEFRRAPEFSPLHLEATPIPANLIEFPRQLIAPKKVRPRIAEGPLRDEAPAEPQLRIFEVEPEQVSFEPELREPTGAPEWQSLLLEAAPADEMLPAPPLDAQFQFSLPPQIAPIPRRLLAAAVDAACVGTAFLAFAGVVVKLAHLGTHSLPRPLLGAVAAVVLLAFFVVYELLFFTFCEATPGMRAARIALCTFGDDNPTRKAMRRRVFATLLAASPLGLGLAWAFLDGERMGWHDRMTRMYQRPY